MVMIRKARLKDVDDMIPLWHEFMDEHREMGRKWREDMIPEIKGNVSDLMRSYFSRNIRSRNAIFLVVEDDGKVKGFMLSNIMKNIPIFVKDPVGVINTLYIDKDLRGKGYSSRMYGETMKWFESKGITEISIKVMSCNDHAYEVYRKWGFKDLHMGMRLDLD